MNYVCLIGVCVEVTNNSMFLKIYCENTFQLYFDFESETSGVEIDCLAKVEGYLSNDMFPFPVVKIKKVFQQVKRVF